MQSDQIIVTHLRYCHFFLRFLSAALNFQCRRVTRFERSTASRREYVGGMEYVAGGTF